MAGGLCYSTSRAGVGSFPDPGRRRRSRASLDLQPPVGPNGHFVSSRREKTPHVFQLAHESQNVVGKLILTHKEGHFL